MGSFLQVPCLTYGMRGMISASIEVRGPKRDLHSGNEGGKTVRFQDSCSADLCSVRAFCMYHNVHCAIVNSPNQTIIAILTSKLGQDLPDTFNTAGKFAFHVIHVQEHLNGRRQTAHPALGAQECSTSR